VPAAHRLSAVTQDMAGHGLADAVIQPRQPRRIVAEPNVARNKLAKGFPDFNTPQVTLATQRVVAHDMGAVGAQSFVDVINQVS